MIALVKPKVILCSIENVNDPDIQRKIQDLEVEYVAVDEAQVKAAMLSNDKTWYNQCKLRLKNITTLAFYLDLKLTSILKDYCLAVLSIFLVVYIFNISQIQYITT